uniref:C40 family peptidase n=1 Tax=Polynucleobacter sp. TaxID=2029855 RepID=UPI0040475A91
MSKIHRKLLAAVVLLGSLQVGPVFAQSSTELELESLPKSFASTVSSAVVDKTETLINNAMQLIGVRYRWGGNTPQSGLDCSGFVRYVFNDTFGFLLPRKSAQMSKVGLQIGKEELRPGDLVFFNTMRHAFSHVGIYVGDNKFIHAPSKGKAIRVDDMTKVYWEKRYNGARRLEDSNSFDVMSEEQRQQLLIDFQERLDKTGRL